MGSEQTFDNLTFVPTKHLATLLPNHYPYPHDIQNRI